MGWATVRYGGRFSYTGELKVRFLQPVRLGAELALRGKVVRHTRLLDFTVAELRDHNGTALATAEGKFVLLGSDDSQAVADALIYSPESWRPPGAESGP